MWLLPQVNRWQHQDWVRQGQFWKGVQMFSGRFSRFWEQLIAVISTGGNSWQVSSSSRLPHCLILCSTVCWSTRRRYSQHPLGPRRTRRGTNNQGRLTNTLSFFFFHSLPPSLRERGAKSGSKLVSQQSFSLVPAELRSLGGDNQCQSAERRDTERTAGWHVRLIGPKRRSEICKHRNVSKSVWGRDWKPEQRLQISELLISWELQIHQMFHPYLKYVTYLRECYSLTWCKASYYIRLIL